MAVATADGLLRLLPLDEAAPCAYAVRARPAHGGLPRPVCQPFAALCCLPTDGSLLLAQRGSGRLLFSPPPAVLGDGGDVFLLGTHEGEAHAAMNACCSGVISKELDECAQTAFCTW